MNNNPVKPSKRLKAPWSWSALLGILALLAVAQPAEAALTSLSSDEFTTGIGPNWLRSDPDGDVYASGGKLTIETTGASQVAGVSSYGFTAELASTEGVVVQGWWARSASGSTTGNADSEIIVRNYYDESQWVSARYVAAANRFEMRDAGGNYGIGGAGTSSEQFFQIDIRSSTARITIGSNTASIAHSMAGTTVFQAVLRDSMHGSGVHISTRDNIYIAAKKPTDTTPPEFNGAGVYSDHAWSKTISTVRYASWLDHNSGIKDGTYTIGTTSGGSNVQAATALPGPPSTGYRWLYTPTWQPPQLAQGINYVNTQVSDVANNVETTNGVYILRYDTVGPVASGSPSIIDWRTTIPTLTGKTWTDPHSGLAANAEYSVGTTSGGVDVVPWTNLASQPSSGQNTGYNPAITPAMLAQGTNFVNVRVSDVLGTVTTTNSAYTVRYDTGLPVGPATPVTLPWSNVNPSLTGACFQDTQSGLKNNAAYKVGSTPLGGDYLVSTLMTSQPTPGQTTQWCPTSWSVLPTALRQGLNYVTVMVQDQAAGSTPTEFSTYVIRYDNVAEAAPAITATTGPGGSALPASTWQTDNTPRFEWTAPTSTSPIAGYSYVLTTNSFLQPDSTVDTATPAYDAAIAPLPDGQWYFRVKAIDTAGNNGAISSFLLWVDVTVPAVPTVSSATHAQSGKFYQATTAILSWTGSDGVTGSGIDGYSWDWVTSLTPALDSTKDGEQTTTSQSYPGLGPFSHRYFRIRALDNVGNVGPVSVYEVGVDTIKPVKTGQFPTSISSDPFVQLSASYDDPDGGLDSTPRMTPVDVNKVVLKVDGVDVKTVYGALCAPTGPLCQYQVTPTSVRFKPLAPWSDGVHNVELTLGDTVTPSNEQMFSWSFTVLSVEDPDADNDNVPDELEVTICDQENPSLAADGSCVGDNWTAPTANDLNNEAGELVDSMEETLDSLDVDNDGIPDILEPILCAEEQGSIASDGSCDASRTNWTPPGTGAASEDAEAIIALAEEVVEDVDGDGDFVPDDLETLLCVLQDPTLASDGSCIGSNWTPPSTGGVMQDANAIGAIVTGLLEDLDGDGDAMPDFMEPTLCAQQNPFLNADGSCIGTNWSAPTAEGIIADVLFLLDL